MRRALVPLLLAAALAGCGGDDADGPLGVVSDAADNLGEIRSGELDLELRVEPEGDGETVGFRVTGPFAFADDENELPVFRLTTTQIAGEARQEATVLSTGERAYVTAGEQAFELTREQTDELRGAAGGDDLGDLEIGDWFLDPQEAECQEGGETACVRSRLDVVAAANDLIGLAQELGADLEELEGADAEQLERAARRATVEVGVDDDRYLRRAEIDVEFGFDPPEALRDLLGGLTGAHLRFAMTIARPNTEVRVEAPADAEPAP